MNIETKDTQQSSGKLNQATYKKGLTPKPCVTYPGNVRLL